MRSDCAMAMSCSTVYFKVLRVKKYSAHIYFRLFFGLVMFGRNFVLQGSVRQCVQAENLMWLK